MIWSTNSCNYTINYRNGCFWARYETTNV